MTPTSPSRAAGANPDRRIVLIGVGVILVLIVLYSLFGPAQDRNDPTPSITNTGTRGARAASLLLPRLGYAVRREDASPGELAQLPPAEAARTTLILSEPILPMQPLKELKPLQAALATFLDHGGRILATGPTGAELLPGGGTSQSDQTIQALCTTTPEGFGPLAAAGAVKLYVPARWAALTPAVHVEQRCLDEAAVVSLRHGAGEAIWWSSSEPLTNGGLRDDAALRLLLASLGPIGAGPGGRTIVFDEYLHTTHETLDDTVAGLPLRPLLWQLAAVGLLMILSFSRRNGPLRSPVAVPRTSPVEFADSMGRLYARAGASAAPIAAARAALVDALTQRAGISRDQLSNGPESLANTLAERFGGDWTALTHHLTQASEHTAEGARPLSPGNALKLVQALDTDRQALEHIHAPAITHAS